MAFPTDVSNIERAEQALGRVLPKALRERLARNNGGEIAVSLEGDWQLHPVWDEANRRTIARTTNHIVHETEEARRWSNFPRGAIAVASDGSGNRLVFRPGSEAPEIWDHESGDCSTVNVDWR